MFISEEITRINLGLDPHQPVEILLEVLDPVNSSFQVAVLTVVVDTQVQIPIVEKCLSGGLGNKGSHVNVELSCQVYVSFGRLTPCLSPVCGVLDFA